VTFASVPHPQQDERSYAADLGENESGIFLILGLDTISENPKCFACPAAGDQLDGKSL
jgi:hypothetical protein